MAQQSWMTRARAYFLKHEWIRGYTLLSPTLIVMICLLALPIFTLFQYSFWSQNYVHIDETFTLKNYETFFDKWLYGKLLWRSIKMSSMVTLFTILLAYPVAYFLAFRVKKNLMMWLVLINIPFVTSYLLRVIAWKVMLGNNGVINSTLMDLGFIEAPLEYLLYSRFAVVLTLTHAWAAFAILPIYVSLHKIDRSLLEAAADLGDGAVKRFFRITLPLSMPGVIAAAIIEFIPTVGDYITPMMVGGTQGHHDRKYRRCPVRRRQQLAPGCGADHNHHDCNYGHRLHFHMGYETGHSQGQGYGGNHIPSGAGPHRREALRLAFHLYDCLSVVSLHTIRDVADLLVQRQHPDGTSFEGIYI